MELQSHGEADEGAAPTSGAPQQSNQVVGMVRAYVSLSYAAHTSRQYLEAVVARDRIECLLKAGELTLSDISAINAADSQLRASAATLGKSVAEERAMLRTTVRPGADAWWWQTPSRPTSRLLSGAFLGLTVAFAASFAKDTLARDPEAWGLLGLALQGLLTFLAGSTFTAAGQQWLENVTERAGMSGMVPRLATIVSGIVATTTILTWWYVPDLLSDYYNNQALEQCRDNRPCDDIPHALRLFRRATSLDQSSGAASRVHFNFGRVYELAHDYPSAIEQYQAAVRDDPDSPSALNNWAWLLLLQDKDLPTALRLLDEAVERVDRRMVAGVAYSAAPSIYKNRGVANARADFAQLAERDLKTAIRLQRTLTPANVAAPHCALAALISKLTSRRDEAVAEAQLCVSLAADSGADQRSAPKIDPISLRTALQLVEEGK